MEKILMVIISFLVLCGMLNTYCQTMKNLENEGLVLSNWELKSSVLEKTTGKEISKGLFDTGNWYSVKVPTTILNGLVKNGVYPDPRIDMNNYLIPDISDKFNQEYDLNKFSYLPNQVNPWKDPYWFKTEFTIPENDRGKQVWLNFNGINYRGEVWLNGEKIADSSEMVGMFQRFRYNITSEVKDDAVNYLAVKIYPVDHPGIPGTQFEVFGDTRQHAVDLYKDETLKISGGWDCALPVRDRNMGIYQPVYISFTENVVIEDPYIVTSLPLPDTSIANLSVSATLFNVSTEKQTGILKGEISLLTDVDMETYIKHYQGETKSIKFEKEVELPGNNKTTIELSYKDFLELTIKNPYLWWPNGYGKQYLHNLKLTYVINGKISDVKNVKFGIREVTSKLKEIDGEYGRIFYINGKKVFCKGGWIQPDMMLDMNKKRIYDEVRLMANANLNLVSSEDMPAPSEDLMDALDKYGLMWWNIFYQCFVIVPGTETAYYPLDHYLAINSRRDIILRYRNHPSLVAWSAANETLPGPDLYFALKEDLKNYDTTRTFLASTAIWWDWEELTPYIKDDLPVGTTDNGAPDYTWYPTPYYFNMVNDVKNQMFRNELGMPAVPPLGSLKKFIFNAGRDKTNPLFPLDSIWAEHGTWDGDGYVFKAYYNAIKYYYGFEPGDIASFVKTAQIVNAENYRAMFEAANSRMWDITSGVMIWKINAAYPDFAWEIFDWYLNPNAGYYFVKRACEPLHIQMNANNKRVSVINTQYKSIQDLQVRARIYDFNMNVKWERKTELNMEANKYQELFSIPQLSEISPIYFVRLELISKTGKILSDNLYWESTQNPSGWSNISTSDELQDVQKFLKSSESPVFSELSKLKNVKLDLTYTTEDKEQEYWVHVKIKNSTDQLSFMNRIEVVKKDNGEEVLPTIWSDNFITLFPGEEKDIVAKFSKRDLNGSKFSVVLDKNY
jgi:hypothetical protein